MKLISSIFYLILCFSIFAENYPEQLILGKYKVRFINDETGGKSTSSRIRIQDGKTLKLVQEVKFDKNFGARFIKKHGKEEILFFETLELPILKNTNTVLNYLTEANLTKVNTIEEPRKDFLVLDLDKDGFQEILFIDFRFYNVKVKGCIQDDIEDNSRVKGSLTPILYSFQNEKFEEVKFPNSKPYLQNYVRELEIFLAEPQSKEDGPGLVDYVHYYSVATQVKMKRRAMKFLKENDKKIFFGCKLGTETDATGVELDLYDFIVKNKGSFAQ
ncbi:MAG: hypothetical protein SFU98_17105 [Leptospiraceae bacterium]|nr:hypothetical protein [Leptospiraceae bacterium]